MRIRNNKVNVFLNDDEKFILKRDSSKLNLSQSEYIIENIVKALEENINCLIKVKNKFHHLGYFEDEQAIGTKIKFLKTQNNTLKNIYLILKMIKTMPTRHCLLLLIFLVYTLF